MICHYFWSHRNYVASHLMSRRQEQSKADNYGSTNTLEDMAAAEPEPGMGSNSIYTNSQGKIQPKKNHETQDAILRSGCSDLRSAGSRSTDQEKHHRVSALLVLSRCSEHALHRALAPGQRQSGVDMALMLLYCLVLFFLSSGYFERIWGVALFLADATVELLA